MAEPSLRILQINTEDQGSGAATVAWNLFQAYRARGYSSWLAVRYKRTDDPDVLVIPNREARGGWSRFWWDAHMRLGSLGGRVRGAWRASRLARRLADPRGLLDAYRGIEGFHFPGTWDLLELTRRQPDIVHCHNLHGGYFDLRALPWLTQQVPVVVTLHDEWLLSGHCAFSFGCGRWETGCGHCPDLTLYSAVRRDATAHNWRQKEKIYARSRLYVSAPSRWLMQRVELSMLAPAVVEARVIPYGVNLRVFHPDNQTATRATLGIAQDAIVLVTAARHPRYNLRKDYQTMEAAVARVAERLPGQRILFLALGGDAPAEWIGQAEVRFVPYQTDPRAVARYYQAADLYLHAARADTFPNTVLEALACGTPVVATAVGGIPEQVKPLSIAGGRPQESSIRELDEATGVLVPLGDAEEMADAIVGLLSDGALRDQLGQNAARDACERFDLNRQTEAYLKWYRMIVERRRAEGSTIRDWGGDEDEDRMRGWLRD